MIHTQKERPVVHQLPQKTNSGLVISLANQRYLTVKSLPPPADQGSAQASTDLSISDLDHCVVNLLNGSNPITTQEQHAVTRPILTAMHIRDIKNSLLLLGDVEGSALVHNLNRCTVVIACRQVSFSQMPRCHH